MESSGEILIAVNCCTGQTIWDTSTCVGASFADLAECYLFSFYDKVSVSEVISCQEVDFSHFVVVSIILDCCVFFATRRLSVFGLFSFDFRKARNAMYDCFLLQSETNSLPFQIRGVLFHGTYSGNFSSKRCFDFKTALRSNPFIATRVRRWPLNSRMNC